MNPLKIIIWGLGIHFKKMFNYYKKEENKKFMKIIGYVDNNLSDDIPNKIKQYMINKYKLADIEFDYIIISSKKNFYDIKNEIIELGISDNKIIDGEIFTCKNFDFGIFYKNDKLGYKIFDNSFQDITYFDSVRGYNGDGIYIELGKKSYVAGSSIEKDPRCEGKILIGNYTSIAWNIHWELGLNMDHDYHRVLNYGITHLGLKCNGINNISDAIIHIGSDVWIGRGCCIKSGIHIGNGAVVASNSLVVKDVPPFAIVGGNPAKLIKYRFESDIIEKLQRIKWWDWDSAKINGNFEKFSNPNNFVDKFYR